MLEDAFEAAEKANNRFNGEKHSNQTLQKELSSFKDVLKKKDEDISGLKGSLQKFKEKVSVLLFPCSGLSRVCGVLILDFYIQ